MFVNGVCVVVASMVMVKFWLGSLDQELNNVFDTMAAFRPLPPSTSLACVVSMAAISLYRLIAKFGSGHKIISCGSTCCFMLSKVLGVFDCL